MSAIDIAMQQRSYIAPQQLYKFVLQLICKLDGNEFAGRSNPARGKGTDLYRLVESARHPPGRPAVDPGRPLFF